MQTYEVSFQPDGVKVKVHDHITIMDAAAHAGIILDSVCGGAGTCNKCLVELADLPDPVRACQHLVDRDLIVTIPDSSRFFEQKILQEGISVGGRVDPLVRKNYVKIPPPSLEDLRSDATRLIDAVTGDDTISNPACRDQAGTVSGPTTISWQLLRCLPSLFKDNNYAATAVRNGDRIFALEAGDTTESIFGLAVDIGTTTVVANLVNLVNGKTVAVASAANPQISFGDDVISRINHSTAHADGLEQLHHRIIECINQLIAELCKTSLVNPWQIYEMTAAGNATMQHLLLSIPVEQIAQAPYVSAISSAVNVPAHHLNVGIHPDANVYAFPSVAAHVGGDTVAVGLSAAMRTSETVNLALDIGTNGELILGNKDRLLTCSTAAGPAFEGARIKFGMRGAAGAIERVYLNQDLEIEVIGGGPAAGICGSGLIDIIAEMLNLGILDPSGRMLMGDDLPDDLPAAIGERVIEGENGPEFVLAAAAQSKQGETIVLTQRDVREAQLGKAAISAGIVMLMKELGVELKDIDRVFLAGAFGNYIRPESACRIGLLPDIELARIQFIGNAAGAGAKEVLLSREAREHAEQLATQMQYVELAGRAEFQDLFGECMFFPEKGKERDN